MCYFVEFRGSYVNSEMEKMSRKARNKEINNFYVPPPARKVDHVSGHSTTETKTKDRANETKLRNSEETKICNNSSLLFRTNNEASRTAHSNDGSSKKKRKKKKKHVTDDSKERNIRNSTSYKNGSQQSNPNDSDCLRSNFNENDTCTREIQLSHFEKYEDSLNSVSIFSVGILNQGLLPGERNNICPPKDPTPNVSVNETDSISTKNECSNIDVNLPERHENEILLTNKHSFISITDSSKLQSVSENKSIENCVEFHSNSIGSLDVTVVTHLQSRNNETKSKVQNEYSSDVNTDSDDTSDIYDWEKLLEEGLESLEIKPSKVSNTDEDLKVSKADAEKEINDSSIIEIYGFPEEFKTQDLLMSFSNFINRGFKLKWVDNTHALGILPSPIIADEVLSSQIPFVKTRPMNQASAVSKEKAKHISLPTALRPKTCAALARRLVSGALGVRPKFTPAEREAEREILKEAREQKKLAAKQRDAAWEGKF